METKALDGQSLADIALQETGTLEGIFPLAVANNRSITDALEAGQAIERTDVIQREIQSYYTIRNLHPATGMVDLPGGIGYMGVEIDFIIS